MSTTLAAIEITARERLSEISPKFWKSSELQGIIRSGYKDLWRNIVDLKQEYYLTNNTTDVSIPANTDRLAGLPLDIHKVYLIEPLDTSADSTNSGLVFQPRDYNHKDFQLARSRDAIEPKNDVIYYSITSQGGPVNAPVIYCAPEVTSAVALNFCYVPTLGTLQPEDPVPIPGEADNALVAWTVAFARAKETEDRAPDAAWLAVYATDKAQLLQSLGIRQYQEPVYVDALFAEYW